MVLSHKSSSSQTKESKYLLIKNQILHQSKKANIYLLYNFDPLLNNGNIIWAQNFNAFQRIILIQKQGIRMI